MHVNNQGVSDTWRRPDQNIKQTVLRKKEKKKKTENA